MPEPPTESLLVFESGRMDLIIKILEYVAEWCEEQKMPKPLIRNNQRGGYEIFIPAHVDNAAPAAETGC